MTSALLDARPGRTNAIDPSGPPRGSGERRLSTGLRSLDALYKVLAGRNYIGPATDRAPEPAPETPEPAPAAAQPRRRPPKRCGSRRPAPPSPPRAPSRSRPSRPRPRGSAPWSPPGRDRRHPPATAEEGAAEAAGHRSSAASAIAASARR
ncbi:hypothetical protein GCM10025880_32550 [Methylorubrum aminovorans]|nr:hypothetical protein GCM10025880_32550 [Methylorubrum aminovorans]